MIAVQIRKDNYDIKHNPKVREKYPALYTEVIEQDKDSFSSWYDLTDKAYKEYIKYLSDYEIGYIK